MTKEDLKNAPGVETLKFSKQVHLSSLKSEIDKLDTDKCESTPVNLSKPSDVVENKIVKKTLYNELVEKT